MKLFKGVVLSVLSHLILLGLNIFALDLHGVSIISREEWGADNSLLFKEYEAYQKIIKNQEKNNKKMEVLKKDDPIKYQQMTKNVQKEKARSKYLLDTFQNEFKIDKIEYKIGNKQMWWQKQYHYNKTKLVIHHTAAAQSKYKNQGEFIEHLRNIYKYHAIRRGWGDIGYHYIIDPWGNIYEGKYGGKGVIGAHAKYNNPESIGIALAGSFDIEKPTHKQIEALIKLSSALAQIYYINPYKQVTYHKSTYGDKYPYIENVSNSSIVGHTDAGHTSCPGVQLYLILPYVKQQVLSNLNKNRSKLINNTIQILQKKKLTIEEKIENAKNKAREEFFLKFKFTSSKYRSKKITVNIGEGEIKNLEKLPMKVLLYKLSTNFKIWELSFDGQLRGYIGDQQFSLGNGKQKIIVAYKGGKYIYNLKYYDKIVVKSKNIVVENYDRKSFLKLPLNIFENKLIFTTDNIKIAGTYVKTSAVLNELSLNNYLKGIGEVGDNQHFQKIKALSIIIRGYTLFYINKKNHHPSIPAASQYNAIDDARFFQRFVGKGFEIVGKKWQKAIKQTKGKYLFYNGNLAFAPYFNCSAGFTYSAKEKWGWTDTPYLQSNYDFASCTRFNGHGVGLSGKGATWLANNGAKYKAILYWYFKGTKVE